MCWRSVEKDDPCKRKKVILNGSRSFPRKSLDLLGVSRFYDVFELCKTAAKSAPSLPSKFVLLRVRVRLRNSELHAMITGASSVG